MSSHPSPPIFLIACKSGLVRVNRPFVETFGVSADAFAERSFMTRVHPEDKADLEQAILLGEGCLSTRIQIQVNQYTSFNLELRQQADEVVVMGSLENKADLRAHAKPVTAPVNVNSLHHTLEMMARIVEDKNPGLRCSILLVDWDTECVFMGVGPSLPAAYNEAINGLHIGPMVGSCGTASYWNLPVIVENIAEDPLWNDLREVAAIAGVAACWSHPITTNNGEVYGAMALYCDEPLAPEKHQMDGLEIASRMVGLAIERDKLENQVRHSTKMDAIGLLAGGIAHDFNNILGAILGNAELAIDSIRDDAPVSPMLENIVKASLNASELCTQLLGFAGKQGSAVELLDCNALVKEIGDITRVTISRKIDLSYFIENESLDIQGDKSQLGQVILNLLTNAAESIGNNEGHISIRTKAKFYSDEALRSMDKLTTLNSGNYICLSVTDSGCGMSEKTQGRVFDPFFTTKPKGRGLGLAAVQGIVQGHLGLLTLKSEKGIGTVFSLLLPQVESIPVSEVITVPAATNTNACILIVDDDEMVREVMCKSLEIAGYSVLTASDGQQGIDLFREKSKAIDCVLLDLNMPKLNGEEVFRELRAIREDIKVILCSGYAKQEVIDRFKGVKLAGVLKKPMKMQSLLGKVADVLGGDAAVHH